MTWKQDLKYLLIEERLMLTAIPSLILAFIPTLIFNGTIGFGSTPGLKEFFFIGFLCTSTFIIGILVYGILSVIKWWKYGKSDYGRFQY